MKELKLEIIECYENDVIATSGLCSRQTDSFFLLFSTSNIDECGWALIEANGSRDNYEGTGALFTYFDENGTQINTNLKTNNWPNGSDAYTGNAMWFHFEGGQFYLCNNKEHRHEYDWE